MSGIAGILSSDGWNVVPLVGSMLSCMAMRWPDVVGLVVDRRIVKSNIIAR